MGENLLNLHFLRNPFLIGVFLIRVKRGAQDVSLYTHVWRSSNATSDSSKVYVPPLASPRQLPILPSKVPSLASGGAVDFILSSSLMSKADGFIRTVAFCFITGEYQYYKITLISCPLLHSLVSFS